MMSGYEAYCEYLALKNHFTLDNYDYLKYNGRTSASEHSFQKRKDKFFFTKLGRKFARDELKDFLIANFLKEEKLWVGNLFDEKHQEVYLEWKKRQQSLTYIMNRDLRTLQDFLDNHEYKFDDLFAVRPNQHPILLELFQEGAIELEETLIGMDRVLGFFKRWDKTIDDEILYPLIRKRLKKYEVFVNIDRDQLKEKMKELFT